MLARQAPAWIVSGGGHFALVAGGCLSLLPAGHVADRWGARRALLSANVATGILLTLLLSRQGASVLDLVLSCVFALIVLVLVAVSGGVRLAVRYQELTEGRITVQSLADGSFGRAIAERYGIAIYDALIVSSAELARCRVLYSEDFQDGQRFEGGVVVRNPFN